MRALLMMTSAGAICRSLLTCAGSPRHRIRPVQLSSGVFIMSAMQPQSAGGWREGGCELVVLPIAALEADVFTLLGIGRISQTRFWRFDINR
jgi:hypothetical protein